MSANTVKGEMRSFVVADLGRTSYTDCWDLQRRLARLRAEDCVPDILLLTEHDHVFTIGTSGTADHVLAGNEELQALGVDIVWNDRGGDVTYHGPGQLVVYPILNLSHHYHDLHRYLRDLEEVVIRALTAFGISGSRMPEYTGVWVGREKICAIGIHTARWVTMHGFALNVSTDLRYFRRIIPCGIVEMGVTSMEECAGKPVSMGEVAAAVIQRFGDVFSMAPHCVDPQWLQRFAAQKLEMSVPLHGRLEQSV